MIFQDRYGNIVLSADLEAMSREEIERRGLHVIAG